MKIVYLVTGPLNSRWQSYYCLDAVAEHYDIAFWDCSRLVEFSYQVSEKQNRPYVVEDITFDNIEAHLQQLPKDTVIVPEIAITPSNYRLFRQIAKYVSTAVRVDFWESPMAFNIPTKLYVKEIPETLRQRVLKIIRQTVFNCWWKSHFKTFVFSQNPQAQYSLNVPDVEKYYQLQQDNNHRNGRYVVYIGQYFPFHADTQRLEGADVVRLAPSFYKSLNTFFERVEKEMDCEVIIAEHPSAKHTENPFGGRQIIYYQTAELIRDSIAVCMHFSNSSSFVILYDKPVALLECKAITETVRFCRHNREFAAALGRKVVDIDSIEEVKSVFTPIDKDLRQKALDLLLRKGDKQLNAELFVKYFNEIEKIITK